MKDQCGCIFDEQLERYTVRCSEHEHLITAEDSHLGTKRLRRYAKLASLAGLAWVIAYAGGAPKRW